jgi:tetratricopeptide (TPR) repeat protein
MPELLTSERDREVLRSFAHRIDEHDPGAHNNLGVLYFNKGMTEEAVAEFTRALELDSRMTIAQRNLEIAYFTSGYYDRRVDDLTTRLASADDRGARWELARTYLVLGDGERAVAEFERLHQATPDDVDVLRHLALAEAKAGALERATQHLEAAIAVDPANRLLHLQLGEVAYHRGLNDLSRAALTRCVELVPDEADALYLLGFVLGDLGDHEAAREATQRALRINPSLGRAHANLSLERFDARSYDRARAVREARGLRDRPAVVEGGQLAHFNLGLAFRQKGYLDEAVREYRLALEGGEDAHLVQQALAEVQLLRKDSRSAVAAYDALLRDRPTSPKLWNERGVALHQGGAHREALESYERAVSADPEYALALNNLGVAAFHAHDVARAHEAFQRALELRPGFITARLNLALLLVQRRENERGLETYRQVLRLSPDHPVAWNGIGIIYGKLGRHADARDAFSRAIDQRSDYAEAHYNLSFTLSHLGEYAAALRATKRALELDPYYLPQKFALAIDLEFEDPRIELAPELGGGDAESEAAAGFDFEASALEALFDDLTPSSTPSPPTLGDAYTLLAAGDFDAAQAAIRRALAHGASRAEALTALGDVFSGRGAFGEAVERYREARAHDPAHGPAAFGEVRALVTLHRFREAAPVAEWLASYAAHHVDALLLVARVRQETDRSAEAREALERARKLAPLRGDVLTALGRLAHATGEVESALAAYRDAISIDGDAAPPRLILAELLLETGDGDAAERELVTAIRLLPDDADAVLLLARLRRGADRPAETIPLLADFLARQPYHLDALVSLAESLVALDRFPDAEVAIARVLRFDREHVGGLYWDGVGCARRGEFEAAIARWAAVVDLEPASAYARRARHDARVAADMQRIFGQSPEVPDGH